MTYVPYVNPIVYLATPQSPPNPKILGKLKYLETLSQNQLQYYVDNPPSNIDDIPDGPPPPTPPPLYSQNRSVNPSILIGCSNIPGGPAKWSLMLVGGSSGPGAPSLPLQPIAFYISQVISYVRSDGLLSYYVNGWTYIASTNTYYASSWINELIHFCVC